MLNLSLTAVARAPVTVQGRIEPDDPVWGEDAPTFVEPLTVDLTANTIGEGVFVRGRVRARVELECRRCLRSVPLEVDEVVDLLYEPVADVDAEDLAGEVYPLQERGDELDLRPAVREQFLLHVPQYVVCDEACKGLCPQCGADLNQGSCDCVPESGPSPWDALKNIDFD